MTRTELVARALRRIEAGALDESSIDGLASQLGVTSRHLRRAWRAELGVSPVQFVQARRLALAKQLVEGTSLAMTEVAFASGFQSVRRFNSLFARAHGRTPSTWRRSGGERAPRETLLVELAERSPLEWSAVLDHLAARAIPGVELADDGVYCRTVSVGEHAGWIAIYPYARRSILHAEVSLSLARVLAEVVARARRLVAGGEFDEFEAAVRAVLDRGHAGPSTRELCGRLSDEFGGRFRQTCVPLARTFPRPEQLARASIADLARAGIDGEHARTILALARARMHDRRNNRSSP